MILLCPKVMKAEITLPSIFSDHMVLQRNAEVKIWGWTDLKEKIFITGGWDLKMKVECIVNDAGKWSAIIKTKDAGGPYTLNISSNHCQVKYSDIMLGEVWLVAGQSNMAINLHDIAEDTVLVGQYDIRFFNVGRKMSQNPEKNGKGKWESSLQSPGNCSAVAFYFAQTIQNELKVPVGLINASWGCTHIEQWIDQNLLKNDKEAIVSARTNADCDITGTGNLFNGMISPLIPYTFKGALWYQGESNRYYTENYEKLFKTMISNWRKAFGSEFPFYYVQIAPYDCEQKAYLIREAQSKALSVKKTGMVVISDLVDDIHDIHPRNKYDVGIRLANLALQRDYVKKNIGLESPLYKSYEIKRGGIIIQLKNVSTGLLRIENGSKTFLIAGADKKFLPATAEIKRHSIVVSSSKIKHPVAVRYCFDNTSLPDVFSREGLPLGMFRTDSWETH